MTGSPATRSSKILESLLQEYRQRTAASARHRDRAARVLPAGVSSNLRIWRPYPLYFRRAEGARMWDADGQEYLDCAAAQGVLIVGHRNPRVMEAVTRQLGLGTVYGGSHLAEAELAEVILQRYPFHEQVRITNTGAESVQHAIRLARAYTGRSKILKAEGTYHGNYDPTLVSFTPGPDEAGDPRRPTVVPVSGGLTAATVRDTVVFPFNDVTALEELLDQHAGQVAAIITEPVILNMGCTPAVPGYLQSMRQLCDHHDTLLIFDEAKTNTKIAYGGGPEFCGVKPDLTCLAKAIGGGFPIGAIAGPKAIMGLLEDSRVWQTGSFAANPVSVAASIATLRDVLTPEIYPELIQRNTRLQTGLEQVISDHGVTAHVTTAGVTGSVFFCRPPVRNYRDALKADEEDWFIYWYGMLNRGIIPQSYGRDDAWTLTLAHTDTDIDRIITAFGQVAALIAEAQHARAQ